MSAFALDTWPEIHSQIVFTRKLFRTRFTDISIVKELFSLLTKQNVLLTNAGFDEHSTLSNMTA